MHRYFKLFALLLFACGCQQSVPVKNNGNAESEAQTKQTIADLFDTTPAPLRNTDHFHTVEIRQMKFVPAEIRVHKGDTIAWINNDIVVHDITEEKNKEWSSSALPIGASWQRVADKSADYFCSIHVVMKGKIVVE
jgi:plastocyanin